MITSAGCNALDYLLDGPAEIHAIDVNPRQNAVLELKLALIRRGEFDDLFEFFNPGFDAAIAAAGRDLAPGGHFALVDFHARPGTRTAFRRTLEAGITFFEGGGK
jgi:S-adenosylmethionine:diacylglycerol 3-amino-3-carboxypropyl transferase